MFEPLLIGAFTRALDVSTEIEPAGTSTPSSVWNLTVTRFESATNVPLIRKPSLTLEIEKKTSLSVLLISL